MLRPKQTLGEMLRQHVHLHCQRTADCAAAAAAAAVARDVQEWMVETGFRDGERMSRLLQLLQSKQNLL